MLNRLFDIYERIAPISTELKEYLNDTIKCVRLPKKHLLLVEGQVCRNIFFIDAGFVRAYYAKDGKEMTSWFSGAGEVVMSIKSFLKQTASAENIELLADSTLLALSYSQLQFAYQNFSEFNYIGRVLTERYFIISEERATVLRVFSARHRYEDLLKKHPEILQKASLGQIASHLGITQETLSRIRRSKCAF